MKSLFTKGAALKTLFTQQMMFYSPRIMSNFLPTRKRRTASLSTPDTMLTILMNQQMTIALMIIFLLTQGMMTRYLSTQEKMMTRYLSTEEKMMTRYLSTEEKMMTRYLSIQEKMMTRYLSTQEKMMTRYLSIQEKIMTRYLSTQEKIMTRYLSTQEKSTKIFLPPTY